MHRFYSMMSQYSPTDVRNSEEFGLFYCQISQWKNNNYATSGLKITMLEFLEFPPSIWKDFSKCH